MTNFSGFDSRIADLHKLLANLATDAKVSGREVELGPDDQGREPALERDPELGYW